MEADSRRRASLYWVRVFSIQGGDKLDGNPRRYNARDLFRTPWEKLGIVSIFYEW